MILSKYYLPLVAPLRAGILPIAPARYEAAPATKTITAKP